MSEEEFCLIPVHKVKPLTDKINDSTYTEEKIKELRALCVKGREIQDLIMKSVSDDFYLNNLKTGNPLLFVILQLCNNMCVQNEETQNHMFPLITPLFKTIEWDIKTATIALSFVITCTQPGSPNRKYISMDLIEPFLKLPATDEELEFRIVVLLPTIANDAMDYALKHEEICFVLLERVHDALECQPEFFDVDTVIPHLLQLIAPDRLPVKQAKSKIVAIFATFVGCSEPARRKALELKAVDAIMNTKKIDRDDPILLEWSQLSLRYLTGDIDDITPEGKQ
ncbi:hypothetical protein TRFO_38234 [Tritrichomonas foetus]|uniref:Uncharacterized protein n=1 Tax=Tritrichomonas foetus TaxID=1144522 RepID=A0A1J4JBM2_9EUKA|nr:hypothetical protein TRFO_38234 [Tritrichomonas foetus]|eukprot:OHS95639.1 hypothetical protein TRFO_38234 [Tritrichomonas foetus]